MSECDPAAVEEPGSSGLPGPPGPSGPPSPPGPARPPLAAKALSEPFGQLRYRDTSLLIWQQQQLQAEPPSTYLTRSQSAWYSSYGNQAVLIRDRRGQRGAEGQSRICSLM